MELALDKAQDQTRLPHGRLAQQDQFELADLITRGRPIGSTRHDHALTMWIRVQTLKTGIRREGWFSLEQQDVGEFSQSFSGNLHNSQYVSFL